MIGSLKQALSIGLMATFLLPVVMPARAAENEAATKTDEKPTTETRTVAKTPYEELHERMNTVEHRIVDSVSSGRLSSQQGADLKKQLDAIVDVETQFRAEPDKFTHWQVVRLHTLLDKLSGQIEANLADRDLAAVDLEFARQDLLKRIDLAAVHGRLTAAEVTSVKQRFNRILALETALRRQFGRLSYADKLMLSIDFDHLAQEIRRQMGERSLTLPEIDKAAANIDIKIQEGIKSGKVSESQAAEFRKQLNELKDAEDEMKKSGQSERDQLIALGVTAEQIANSVGRLLEPPPSVEVRLAKIDHRLGAALDAGELTPMETMQLKEDLDAILAAHAAAGTASSTSEALPALKLDVARLESRLERQVHSPGRVWSGMTALLTHLGVRNKAAANAKRLSEEEAKSFSADLQKLATRKQQLEAASGGINSAQALELAEDIQRMGARLEKSMKDREMAIPDIDALTKAINNRIAEATMAGDISSGEARSAVLRLGEINSLKERHKISDNALNNREIFNVAYELERLATNMEEEMHGHAPFFPGVDNRRGQIEALIEEGVSSGRLNTAEAVLLKTTLAETSTQEKQYRSDSMGLTAEKALELVGNLEREWQDLDRQLREQAVLTSDLVSLQGSVEKKLRQGFSYGLLTHAEAETLRSSYDNVVDAMNRWRAADGGLSYGERLAFAYGFQRLNASAERQMRVVPLMTPSIDEQRAQAEHRLGAVLASGRLPIREAQDLKELLDEIVRNMYGKRRSGGGLSYQESIIISMDLDRLNSRIEQRVAAVKPPLPDIDARQSELDKLISENQVKGTLSLEDAHSLKSELERVALAEAAFRISDESINYAEAINLVLDLERIKARLNTLSNRKMSAAPAKTEAKKAAPKK
ncbi:MAG: hypothetical protein K2X77_05260 [Candidatus Obscuribacterales bacterium]|nr:hypothetical protein [Candidatus Obscuribacterales bacterium]